MVALINEGIVLRALNFAQAYYVQSVKISFFLEYVDHCKGDDKTAEADVPFKRIAEVMKV